MCVHAFVNFFFKKNCRTFDWIFSSPEHNILKGSFQGGPVSVNNFSKHLPKCWANLDQTWQENK